MPPQLLNDGGWVDDPDWQDDVEPSMWERLNTPMTKVPTQIAKSAGDWLTQPTLATSPTGQGGFHDYLAGVNARMKGFGAGAMEGLGNIAESITSPLGAATTLLTLGEGASLKAGLPQIARLLGWGGKAAGAAYGTHGAMEIGQGAYEGDLGRVGRGTVELAGGALGVHGTPKPTVKPTPKVPLATAAEDLAGAVDIKRPNAANFTPEEFAGINEFMGKGADEAEVAAIREGASKPAQTPVKTAIETARINEGGWVDDSPTPSPKTGPRKLGEGIYDPFASYREVPVGTTYKVAPKDMPRKKLVEAIRLGFDYVGMDDSGKIILKKIKESPAPDLVEVSPGQLGVKTDLENPSHFWEAFNLSRGLQAAVDLSAPLRQGIGLIHKKEFRQAIPAMFRSWASEDGFRALQNDIMNRPMFRKTIGADGKVQKSFAEKSGLSLSDLTNLNKREEAIMSTWAEKLWGVGKVVRRSNRAYTGFLNKLRADTFENLVNKTESFGVGTKNNLPLARSLADFVNTATGRGNLGALERAAVPLNSVLFSPRLMASRLRMLDPRMYLMGPKVVRREAIKSLFAIAGVGATVTELGKLAGGTVENDPNSSDFGKVRIGNTRIDPYGGFQQYIVAANRLARPAWLKIPDAEGGTDTPFAPLDTLTGFAGKGGQQVTSSQSENEYDLWNPQRPFDPTHLDVAGRFLRGKAHPVLGFVWSLFGGQRELSGEPMNFTTLNPMENSVAQRFIPILLQDMYELSKTGEIEVPTKLIVGAMAALGMGTQTYGEED